MRTFQLTEDQLKQVIIDCQPIGDVDAIVKALGEKHETTMLEIGVEGHAFHPHKYTPDCDVQGCIVMPEGWKNPYER